MLDAERQIRFVYPPVFFVASLFLGIRLDDDVAIAGVCKRLIGEDLFDKLGKVDWSTLVVALATAGGLVATIAVGFLISCVTILALRTASRWCVTGSYEAVFLSSPDAVRRRLRAPLGARMAEDAVFLSATIDHEVIARPVHGWVFRRWTMFYVYAHSATALLLAWLLGGLVLGIVSMWWTIVTVSVGVGFICLAVGAWRDTMGMLRFQAQRPFPKTPRSAKENE